MRLSIKNSLTIFYVVLMCCSLPLQANTFSVKDFGAQGDGRTDDTAAIQSALDKAARQGGGIVTLGIGHYLVNSHLKIPDSVTLEGLWRKPPTKSYFQKPGSPGDKSLTGSVLLAVAHAGTTNGTPFLILENNATVKGLTVFYPNQRATA